MEGSNVTHTASRCVASARVCPDLLHKTRHRRRRFLLMAIGQADGRPAYKARREFWCSWKTLPRRVKAAPGYTRAEVAKAGFLFFCIGRRVFILVKPS